MQNRMVVSGVLDTPSYGDILAETLIVVVHGSTAGTTRPADAVTVLWIGSVTPTNAINGDLGIGWTP